MNSAQVFVSIPRRTFSAYMVSAELGLKLQGKVSEAAVTNYHSVHSKFAGRAYCSLFSFALLCWGYLIQGSQSCPSDHKKESSSALPHLIFF